MKYLCLTALLISSSLSHAQKVACNDLKGYYQKVSEMNFEGEPPFDVRLPMSDILALSTPSSTDQSQQIAATHLIQLQRMLDGSNRMYKDGEFWNLKSFEAEYKYIGWIKKECPNINLKVLEDEIAFYESKYVPFEKMKDQNALERHN